MECIVIMRRLFQREMTEKELIMYNKVISDIKNTTKNLVKELDDLIKNYTPINNFETKFFLEDFRLDLDR